jgi:DNA-binding response OmpR family regulator
MPAASVSIAMNVFLIEPDAILAGLYGGALCSVGHDVLTLKTAQAAVSAAEERIPDVVVLATEMARHNGVEFLYEFKSYTEWRDVPVVLLVSSLNHDVAEQPIVQASLLGGGSVLVKSQTSLHALCQAVAAASRVKSP